MPTSTVVQQHARGMLADIVALVFFHKVFEFVGFTHGDPFWIFGRSSDVLKRIFSLQYITSDPAKLSRWDDSFGFEETCTSEDRSAPDLKVSPPPSFSLTNP